MVIPMKPTPADLEARRDALALELVNGRPEAGPELEAIEMQIAAMARDEDRGRAAARERDRRDAAARARQEAELVAEVRQRLTLGRARRAALAAQLDQQLASASATTIELLRAGGECYALIRELKKLNAWSPADGHDNDRLIGKARIGPVILRSFPDIFVQSYPWDAPRSIAEALGLPAPQSNA